MDVKSTFGRQGHYLILFSLFLARKFLLHLIRSSDPTSVPCIRGSLELYSYHYQLGHLLTHRVRHYTSYARYTHVLHSHLCLAEDKGYSMPLFEFLIVVYLTRYVPYIMRLYEEAKHLIISKAWVCS